MSRFSLFEGEDAYAKAMGKKVDFENNRVKIDKALVSTKSKVNGVHCRCSTPEEGIKIRPEFPDGVPKSEFLSQLFQSYSKMVFGSF